MTRINTKPVSLVPDFIVVDLFCGAGGTSLGFDRARAVGGRIAQVIACVNHATLAIRSHAQNFPECVHFTEDVRKMDLQALAFLVAGYRKKFPKAKLILWASLECTHFSNAKTGSRKDDSRTLAHALYAYIAILWPDLMMIENVREFMSWGPLVAKVTKCKTGDFCPLTVDKKTGLLTGHMVPENRKKGIDYIKWRQEVEGFGYRYQSRLLNSADYGSHQSRLRYFGVFARAGMPIVFPEPTHDKTGRHGLPKWKPVREVLNLEEIGISIFDRKKPLSPKTLERVMAGLIKFVANGQPCYLVKNYSGKPADKVVSLDSAAPTITCVPHESLVTTTNDFLFQYNGTAENSTFSTDGPCHTVCTRDSFAVVQAWMDNANRNGNPTDVDAPCKTLVTEPRQSLVTAWMDNKTRNGRPSSINGAAPTLVTCPAQSLVTTAFIDNQFGNGTASSVNDSCGALTTVNKRNLVTAVKKQDADHEAESFLMATNYNNQPRSLERPSQTLIASRNQYLVNPQFSNKGSSLDNPCFTLIAKMDKMPPSLVTVAPKQEGGLPEIYVDPVFYKDTSVDVLTRIQVFMAVYGISDIFMRMLFIPELMRIQGFNKPGEPEYILEGPKDQQKKFIGNAVVPDVVTAWIEAYHREMKGQNVAPQLQMFA